MTIKYIRGFQFRSGGFDCKILDRKNNVALLSKQRDGLPHVSFEVVKVKYRDGFTVAGREVPAGEHLPASEDWGTSGWTYPNENDARKKMDELLT